MHQQQRVVQEILSTAKSLAEASGQRTASDFAPKGCRYRIIGATQRLSHIELQILEWLCIEVMGFDRLANLISGATTGPWTNLTYEVPLPTEPWFESAGPLARSLIAIFKEGSETIDPNNSPRVRAYSKLCSTLFGQGGNVRMEGRRLRDANELFADIKQGSVVILQGLAALAALVDSLNECSEPVEALFARGIRHDSIAGPRYAYARHDDCEFLHRLEGQLYRKLTFCGPAMLLEAKGHPFVCCPEPRSEAGQHTKATRASQIIVAKALARILASSTQQLSLTKGFRASCFLVCGPIILQDTTMGTIRSLRWSS